MAQKAVTTQLKEAVKRIEELEKELKNCNNMLDSARKARDEKELELDSVHSALDAMMVPRTVKSGYSEKTMTVASRLFAWQAGARVENVKREID